MKVLVAGATGAIGRPLVSALMAAGHEVIGMSSSENGFVSQKCDGTLSGLLSLCYALAVKTSPPWARPLRSPCRTGRLDLIFRRAGIQEEKHRASAAKAAAEMMLPVTRCS